MRRVIHAAAALATVLMAAPAVAKAIAIAPNRTGAQQAMQAEVIVVGKVAEIEKEMTQASQSPGQPQKAAYHVGVVKINESILGAKGLTTLRVGFLPAPKVAPPVDGGPIRRPPIGRFQQATLTDGQEGVFFLNKHHDGDFYVMQQFGQPLDKKAANFDKQLDTVKKIVKTVEDPMAALKAKEAADRQLAAAILIQRYRTRPAAVGAVQPKQADVPAEESRLILQTIAEMDWNKYENRDGIAVSARSMFGMLNIPPGQHGFDPPKAAPGQKDFAKVYAEYAQKWLKDNVEKYRVQKWVAGK